nr:MAG TPA: hypothetical protein [Caudoviricetes sp.]
MNLYYKERGCCLSLFLRIFLRYFSDRKAILLYVGIEGC